MDDLNLSPDEPSAKKPRKSPAKRTRSRAAQSAEEAPQSESPAPAETVAAEASAPAKRVRTRRSKAAPAAASSGDDAPAELFATPVETKPAASAPEPAAPEAPVVYSFSPDDPDPAPEPAAADKERPVFVPETLARPTGDVGAENNQGERTGSESAEAPSSGGGEQGAQAGGGRKEDRKSWWEKKKEKKRQKWLERQQNAAGGGRERNPAQPPPPSLQTPVGSLPSDERFADPSALDAVADELAQRPSPLDLTAIHAAPAGDLARQLTALGETVVGMPPRRTLVEQIFAWAHRENQAFREVGILDLTDAGHGFVTHRFNSYRLYPESTFVPAALVKRHGLRRGQEVEVLALPPKPGERCPAAVRVLSVMGTTVEKAREVTVFEELIPYYPTARILVEATEIHKDISMRAVDLLTPIGFGQRGLIVAPPRTGKTVLLQNIANSISHNYPEATLILLLIDERPEEVTDFKRHTKGEVVSSTFDESPESHVHAAEMVIERARRLVEMGKHVVILLDSITRLARAYNALAGNGGKTMSGGLESNALQRPKRFFGSARNIEGGGSLTILATALIDTNSRMDEVIFEEFKGTGNMELHLDRGLSDKRIFPAINIDRSGTRKEELIYHPDEMLRVYGLRRAMQGIPPVEAMDMFIQRLKKTRTNTEFLLSLNR
jgi:transcription termination factor Rho